MLRIVGFILVLGFLSFNASGNSAYVLGPGDKVEIKVFGHEDLSVTTILGANGKINYPFLGEIDLSGLTVKQVEQRILSGLKGPYLVDPNLYVHILEYRPFYIHGEVKNPGSYPFKPGITVNQAVALAGGFTERASKSDIKLIREGAETSQIQVALANKLSAGDTITIERRFF